MNIYLKPQKKVSISGKTTIRVKDVADVYAENSMKNKVENVELFKVSNKPKKNYLVSIIDIVSAIDKEFSGHTIYNIGETDIVIDYAKKHKNPSALWKWSKVFFISLVLFAGSATAIMSFHSDSEIPSIFKGYYKLFFNQTTDNLSLISIPYSIGLCVGIMIFFNHFMGKKITDDPTPIEVEMSKYESDVTETMVDLLNDQKKINKGV